MTINNIKNQPTFSNMRDEGNLARFHPGEKDGGLGGGTGLGQGAPGGFSLPQIRLPKLPLFGRPFTAPKTPSSPVNLPFRNIPSTTNKGVAGTLSTQIKQQNNTKIPYNDSVSPFDSEGKRLGLPKPTSGYKILPFRKNPEAVKPKVKPPNYCKKTTTIEESTNYKSGIYSSDGSTTEYPWAQKVLSLVVKVESPFATDTQATALIIGGDAGQGRPYENKAGSPLKITAEALSTKKINPEELTPKALKSSGISLVDKVNSLSLSTTSEGACFINGVWTRPNIESVIHRKFQNGKEIKQK
jgi:hypothetical protein